ncbi:uridine diphosphate-N-acetylglucosamine-binding protein YvcK [Oceanithermus sp.]|uniref:gluconeogenesis factor YvcK family protein n=1 Tax=Oceanithermus sp. TaxID=2268145 RepID=UPI00257D5981|nr:uridine diphosphate-N-acetylglucosamine-binding protein YvcK [Oceanithermus sp.]
MWAKRARRLLGFLRWLRPGMGVKRYVLVAAAGMLLMFLGVAQLSWQGVFLDWVLDFVLFTRNLGLPLWLSGTVSFLVGLGVFSLGIRAMNRSILSAVTDPDELPERIWKKRRLEAGPRVVALGGGTGLSNLLGGLKTRTANLTGVVAVTDDGGSTGRLRRSFDVPAVGDLTDCLAALSEVERMPELMKYRFQRGEGLSGHTFGNLFLVSLFELTGDFAEAVRMADRVLALSGAVYPSTPHPARLVAELAGGERVEGESRIREAPGRVRRVWLEPENPPVMPEVLRAVARAQLIVLGPGSLFTSVIPSFLPPDLRRAIAESPARLVYVVNVMTEPGETDGMDAYAHYKAVAEHLGRRPDAVLVHTAPLDPEALARYAEEGQYPVAYDAAPFDADGVRVVEGDFAHAGAFVRHDPEKLTTRLLECVR